MTRIPSITLTNYFLATEPTKSATGAEVEIAQSAANSNPASHPVTTDLNTNEGQRGVNRFADSAEVSNKKSSGADAKEEKSGPTWGEIGLYILVSALGVVFCVELAGAAAASGGAGSVLFNTQQAPRNPLYDEGA